VPSTPRKSTLTGQLLKRGLPPPEDTGQKCSEACVTKDSIISTARQNVYGQRFDVMQPGTHTLLHIPKGSGAKTMLLHVSAEAQRMGTKCSDMYFQEMNLTGAWPEAKQVGGFHFHAGEDSSVEDSKWMSFGKVDLKVVHGQTQQGIHYLNFFVKHLKHLKHLSIGGLLGEDDHSEVAKVDETCSQRINLFVQPGSPVAVSPQIDS